MAELSDLLVDKQPVAPADPVPSAARPQPVPRPPEPGSRDLGTLLRENPNEKLTQAVRIGSELSPELTARVLAVESRSGLPRKYIEENLDEMERAVAPKSFDPMNFRAKSPKFAQWLAGDPARVSIAQKDVALMSGLEQAFRGAQTGWEAADTERIDLWYRELQGRQLSPEEMKRRDALDARAREVGAEREGYGAGGYWATQTAYAARQAGQSVYAMAQGAGYGGAAGAGMGAALGPGAAPGAATGMSAGALVGSTMYAYRLEAASTYAELRGMKDVNGQPIDPEIARNVARGVGVANALIEMVSTAALGKVTGTLFPTLKRLVSEAGADAAKRAMAARAKEMLAQPTKRAAIAQAALGTAGAASTQSIEEFAQELVGSVGREVAQARSGQEFAPDDWRKDVNEATKAAVDTFVGSLTLALPFGGVSAGRQIRAINRAQQNQVFFQALGDTAANSDMAKKLPEAMRSAVAEIKAGGDVQNVYVPVAAWNALFQADAQRVAQEVLGDTRQYDEAQGVTGGDLIIPVEVYAEKLAATPFHQQLMPDMRLRQGDLSLREAEAIEAKAEDLAETQLTEAAAQAETVQKRETIRQSFYDELRPIMGESEANRVATLQALRYDARAERMGVDPVELWKREGAQVAREMKAVAQAEQFEQAAYHGTPHLFDRFSMEKIGTGEGAQAYGHGLYFAENAKIAESYRLTLASSRAPDTEGIARSVGVDLSRDAQVELIRQANSGVEPSRAANALQNANRETRNIDAGKLVEVIKRYRAEKSGALYTVDIPDAAVARMLDWDKSMSQQAPEVRAALATIDNDAVRKAFERDLTGKHLVKALEESLSREVQVPGAMTGVTRKVGGARAASELLLNAGIPGTKYLDAGSRGEGDGTRNFVVFDDSLITIMDRNGEPVETMVLYQRDESDMLWRNWEPETTEEGKLKGAPEWVESRKDHVAMRKLLRKFVEEGVSGRYWYENSARAVVQLVRGNLVDAEKFIQLIAIYSPNNNVWGNTLNAIKAFTQWKNGVPREKFHVAMPDGDGKAINVLYDNGVFAGRKVNSFYLNLMHDIVETYPESIDQLKLDKETLDEISKPVTVDVWVLRALGYRKAVASNDLGRGKYSFSENEIRRLTAELNEKLGPDEARWTPHQVQAAIWTAIKSRFEIPSVKALTNKKSEKQGLITRVGGNYKYNGGVEKQTEHIWNWRTYALQPTSAEAKAAAEANGRSFSDDLNRLTEQITAEAIPSEALGFEINKASAAVRAMFTAEAHALIVDEGGRDMLAEKVGVPINWSELAYGAYAGGVNPNWITRIIPVKGQGAFSRDEVRLYARSVQYITMQDAVPWFRPDNKMAFEGEVSKSAREEQQFRLIGANGKMVAGSRRDTLAEIQKLQEERGKGEKIQGGKFARGVAFKFDAEVDPQRQQQVLQYLARYLGPDAGFTRTARDEISIINFRDDESGVPFARSDEEFIAKLDEFDIKHGEALGVTEVTRFWSEGEYGHVHDWQADPTGTALLKDEGSLAERSDLHPWLRDRRDAFKELLGRYSGEELKTREQEARSAQRYAEVSSGNGPFYQPPDDGRGTVRGQFQPAGPGVRPLITLFRSANPSTALHELSHSWLEELRRDAEGPNATEQLKADWAYIRQWAGVGELQAGEVIPRAAHEMFARGTEAYVMEGNAPSLELRAIFARFKDWLVRIYRAVKDLGVEITPEFKQVLDRMLATDEQIERARQMAGVATPSALLDAMTPDERAAYGKTATEAKLEAEERVRAQTMSELVRERTDWWRNEKRQVQAEVAAEFNERPEYRAGAWLRTGKLPDGTELPVPHQRLDKAALVAAHGPDILQRLAFMWQAEGGLHPDAAAEMLGFATGEEMIQAILAAPPRAKAIAEEADRRMLERHGDMLNDGSLAERAAEAVQSDKQADVLLIELRILKRLGAQGQLAPARVLREVAKAAIDKTPIAELRPAYYEATGARAAYEAERAMIEQRYDDAFAAKMRQLVNLYMHRAATEHRKTVDKSLTAWKRLDRPDERLAKSRDVNLVNTARAILAAYGVGRKQEDATTYLGLVNAYDPQAYADLIEIVTLATQSAKPLGQLTMPEFLQVKELVDGMWALSRLSQQVTIEGRKVDKEAAKQELFAAITALGTQENRVGYDRAASKWDRVNKWLHDAKAAFRRVEHWVEAMDQGKPGAFRKYMWEPVSQAAERYRSDRKRVLERYLELTKMLEGRLTLDKIDAPELGYTFGGNGSGRAELIGALLHTGNESNLSKLLSGRDPNKPWTPEQWGKFIKRMQDTGALTKVEYDFVQAVWDLMESIKPAAQAAHKEMFGYYFSEITAQEFSTPFGTYRGGYFPAITDPMLVPEGAKREDQLALESQANSFMFPTTGRGFTKTRMENYRKPLQLDLGFIPQHMDKVLRFTHLEPRVKEVGRLILDRDMRARVSAFVDTEVIDEMLVPWLQRAAKQSSETTSTSRFWRGMDMIFRELRSRTGAQIMVLNVVNALQQITGLSSSAVKIPPKYLRNALFTYMTGPHAMAEEITAKSEFMRNRTTSSVMEVQAAIDDIMLNPSKYDKARAFARRHGYFLQTGMQNVVDLITWRGAYNQAIEQGADEHDAAKQGDAAVRMTQGSFAPEDASTGESGTATGRAFLMFYSYFNTQANLLGTEFGNLVRKTGFNAPGRLFYIYLYGVMIPAMLAEAITQAMSGELWDDDDDDGYLDNLLSIFFGGQARFIAGGIPFIGQVATAAANIWNDKWYDDRLSTSPVVTVLEAAVRMPYSVYRAVSEDHDGSWKRAIKDTLTLVGLATGLPFAALGRPLGYAADVEQGRVEPANEFDYVRGLISGRAPQ